MMPIIPVFFCCLLFTFLSHPALAETEQHASPSPPVKIQTATVSSHNIRSRVEVAGTVQAVEQAVIAAKISGTIIEIPIVLGSRVNQGDLLIKINAEEISARVLQAQAQLAQAKRNMQREEKLLQRQASTPETVKSMSDMLAIAKAGYREASSVLSYTIITAPFSGVITRKVANTGDLATPGAPLLHLEDDNHLQVVTSVPESIALQIAINDQLSIHFPTIRTKVTGKIAEISPVIDPSSRTSKIKINLSTSTGLRTGMFARVQLPGTESRTLMIPQTAVIPSGQLEKVFVIDNDKAWLRLIRTGTNQDNMVEVLSGLDAGEVVATENNRLLVNGQTVVSNQR